MAEVILDTGDSIFLEFGLTVDYTLRLYTNDIDPVTTNILTDFTECTDATYVPAVLSSANWVVTTEAGRGKAEQPIQTFDIASNLVTIYGWYLDRGGVAVAAGRLSASFTGVGTLRIVPVIHSNNGA